jgi:hypothetical protein
MLHYGKLLLAILLLAATPALGQTLSTDLLAKQNLDADDLEQINSVVRTHVERMETGDAANQRASRRALLTPLQSPATSAAFRLAYSRAAVDSLRRLMDAEEVDTAMSAMLVLGWVATDASVDALLQGLRSERESIRYGSAAGLRRTFLESTGEQSAAPAATVWKAVRRLTAALPEEQSPYVVRAMVSALLASPRETAAVELAQALNERLDRPVDESTLAEQRSHFLLDAYIAAAFGLRNELIQPSQTDQRLFDAAAELGARYLVWCVCLKAQLEGGEDGEIDLSPLAEAGEDLLLIAHLSKTGERRDETISAIVGQAGWPGIRNAVLDWVGADGLLYQRGYDFEPGEFVEGTCLGD